MTAKHLLLAALSWTVFISNTAASSCPSQHRSTFIDSEIALLAKLKARLTGSTEHNQLIDHIESELHCLGLPVSSSSWKFPYYDGPKSSPSISVAGQDVYVSSYAVRSGLTGPDGVTGQLVDLWTSSREEVPRWELARDKIAVTNVTNLPNDWPDLLSVWPDSPSWKPDAPGLPDSSASSTLENLTNAADAGVKGVVYIWQNISAGLAEGLFSPSAELYQDIPVLFSHGKEATETLLAGAKNGSMATLRLEASIAPNWSTRSIWTVVEGTELKNESIIINTHTDGTNVIEENGHILLLLKAAELAAQPPRRTTILLWATGHLQRASFAPPPGVATSRWLAENPQLWAGGGNRHALKEGGQMKAVASSCVEHLGALHWTEWHDTYLPTNKTQPELLYASTSQLNSLLRDHWQGADPNTTRVTDPYTSSSGQLGEGAGFFYTGIPNFSLETNPSYLLKTWPEDFDEAQLIDKEAMNRQIDSFLQMWGILDGMAPGSIDAVEETPAM